MNSLRDISTSTDIKTLVDAFYHKVQGDDLLGAVFNSVPGFEWAEHLPTMYRFWETLLLGAGTYQGAPFPKHAVLSVQQEHFERWLSLFVSTVDENFSGPKSEDAKDRAISIADTFARRMGVLKDPASLARLRFIP
jgi:hemoglobin